MTQPPAHQPWSARPTAARDVAPPTRMPTQSVEVVSIKISFDEVLALVFKFTVASLVVGSALGLVFGALYLFLTTR